jgi:NADPH2:quinone reductase
MVTPKFGEADLFEERQIPKPVPGTGELLVKIMVSGTNPVDNKIRQNGHWAKLNPPVVLGYDASGIVEEVGDGVTGFSAGDEVYFTPQIPGNQLGTYAEYNTVSASIAALKPKGLSFEEAAAIPLAGGTAWDAVIRRIDIKAGETILIHGAAGGVGSFAVQFARAAGARVIATSSARHHELLKELGADLTIDYNDANLAQTILDDTGGTGADAVFDIYGPELASRSLTYTKPFGRIAVILPPQGDLSLFYQKNITLHGVFLMRESKRLQEMAKLFERKQAKVIIDEVLPLNQVAAAHKRLESGHGKGKIVLKVNG